VLGQIYTEMAEWEQAANAFRQSIDIHTQDNALVMVARVQFEEGKMLLAQGLRDEAREALDEALAQFERYDADWFWRQARQLRDSL